MKTYSHSDFLQRLTKIVLKNLILVCILFFSNSAATGQSILCDTLESIEVKACIDTNYNDSCFYRKVNIYFEDSLSIQSNFVANNFELTVEFSGVCIDKELSSIKSGAYQWFKSTTTNTISFRPLAGCVEPDTLDNPYFLPFGSCSNPFAEIFVVVLPGVGGQLIDIEPTISLNEENVLDNCEETCTLEYPFNSSITPATNTICDTNNLIVKIQPHSNLSVDTLVSDPHKEEQLEIVLYNIGSTDITVFDYDLQVIAEDIFNNLVNFDDPDLFLPPIPGGNPLFEKHNQNEHYFFLDQFQFSGQSSPGDSQPLAAGDSTILLLFTVPPPNLGNEYGLADFDVNFVRLSYQDSSGTYCCLAKIQNPNVVVEFPGDVPCEPYPSVTLNVDPGSPLYGDCELYIDVCLEVKDSLSQSDSISIQELLIDIDALTSGNLYIDDITGPIDFTYEIGNCDPAQCSDGGADCDKCLVAISFSTDDPLFYMLHDSTRFTITLRGPDESGLENIEISAAYIQETGDTTNCIPQININEQDLEVATIDCESCLNYSVYLDSYSGNLDSCQSGFSVFLGTRSGFYHIDSIYVEIEFSNLDNLDFESLTSSLNCEPCAPTILPPNAISFDNCLYLLGNTLVYTNCIDSTISGDLQLFDVVFSGAEGDCISNINFTMNTAIEDTTGVCMPTDMTEAGNDEYCIGGACSPLTTITGVVQTEEGYGVQVPVIPTGAELPEDVDDIRSGVFILTNSNRENNLCPFDLNLMNDVEADTIDGVCDTIVPAICNFGEYNANLNCNKDTTYVIMPYKDIDYDNRVSTFDLILIQLHNLGVAPFDSPYKIIAADANNDRIVTTIDMVRIQAVLLQVANEFENNSWRFVDASYVFPNPLNPWFEDFPECIEVNSTDQAISRDFVAIKIGDVSLADTVCFTSLLPDIPSGLDRVLTVDSKKVFLGVNTNENFIQAGEIVNVNFSLTCETPLAGWQLGLKFDPALLELINAVPSSDLPGMTQENFGLTKSSRGEIRSLWFHPEAKELSFKNGITSFQLRFKAKEDLDDILEYLTVSSEVLETVAYELNGKSHRFELRKQDNETATRLVFNPAPFKVEVNPNPFSEELVFNFSSVLNPKGEIWIYDSFGKELVYWEGMINNHEPLIIKSTENWGKGIFLWKIRLGEQVQTGKVFRQ